MRVAVGTLAGQPHGLGRVVWKVQSEKAQDLLQPRFWMVRVAVGQTGAAAFWERARLARPRRVVRAASFMVVGCLLAGDCVSQSLMTGRLVVALDCTWKLGDYGRDGLRMLDARLQGLSLSPASKWNRIPAPLYAPDPKDGHRQPPFLFLDQRPALS
jgi:hypothetical protein